MRRASTWPELDRLCRFVRAADSLTDTLATWTGRGIEVQIVRRVDRVFPEPTLAERLDLHDDARVQEREVRIRCADVVLAEARSWVAVDSPALTPAGRQSLRADGGLGDLLRPLNRRRSTLRLTACRTTPADDPSVPVLLVQARLDVAGTPVAWCEETIYEAVLAGDGDGRRLTAARPRSHLVRPSIPA
jgi:chorismate-pyruvate lyase